MNVHWELFLWAGAVHSLLVSAWVFLDASRRGLPGLKWAVPALLFPPIVPFYLKRTRPRRPVLFIGLWAGAFLLCYSGVAQLAGPKEDLASGRAAERFNGVRTELLDMLGAVPAEKGAGRFENIPQIRDALERLETRMEALSRAEARAAEFLSYLERHEDRIRAEGHGELLALGDLFGEGYRSFQAALRRSLEARRQWLAYARDHYDAILAREEPQNSIYEELYGEWSQLSEAPSSARAEYAAFLKDWCARHPDLSAAFRVPCRISGQPRAEAESGLTPETLTLE